MTSEIDQRLEHLWRSQDPLRYFLIPADADVTPGEFRLSRSRGHSREVAESAVASFEIDEAAAKEWLKGELKDVASKLFKRGAEVPGAEESRQSEDLPLFSALSGESADDLHSDGAAFRRGLGKVLGDFGKLVANATSSDEGNRAAAKVQIEKLRKLMREHDVPVPDTAREPVRNSPRSKASDEAERLLRGLTTATGDISRAFKKNAARLKTIADKIANEREAAERKAEDCAEDKS